MPVRYREESIFKVIKLNALFETGLGIRSFAHFAIRVDRSRQMSDRE